jgi:hypothetical protein
LASIFLLLRQKKDTKDKTAEQFWTALAGPEGFTTDDPGSLDSACAEQL